MHLLIFFQKRFILKLRSETGVLLSDRFEEINSAIGFYWKLYESELFLDESDVNVFFENLPQVPRELNSVLSNAVTLEELQKALQNMECNKGPGIDGLPVEFHKTFWAEVSLDLLQVLN